MAHLPQVAAVFCWTGCVNTLTHAARLLVLMLLLLLLCENERKTTSQEETMTHLFIFVCRSHPFLLWIYGGGAHNSLCSLSRSRQSSFAVVMLRCQGCVTFFGCVNKEGKGSPRRRTCLFPKGVSASWCNGCAQERNCDMTLTAHPSRLLPLPPSHHSSPLQLHLHWFLTPRICAFLSVHLSHACFLSLPVRLSL